MPTIVSWVLMQCAAPSPYRRKCEAHMPAINYCFHMRPQLLHALLLPFSLLRHAHLDALPSGHIILDLQEATVCEFSYLPG